MELMCARTIVPHNLLAPMPGSHGKSLWGQKAETEVETGFWVQDRLPQVNWDEQ